jgi:hypothetical protein
MKAQEIRVLHFSLALYRPSFCLELLTHHKELVKFSFTNGWTDVIHYRGLDKFLCVKVPHFEEKVPCAIESKNLTDGKAPSENTTQFYWSFKTRRKALICQDYGIQKA